MPYSHLRGWTPIAYRAVPSPTVTWADLRHDRYDRLTFGRAVALWRTQEQPLVVDTDLSALTALDDEPALEPNLIIAHPSRCGSSLLGRLAAAADNAQLLLEPPVLLALMQHDMIGTLERPIEEILRQAVRAMSRGRWQNQRQCVLKLNSHTTRFLPQLRKAFPKAPVIWVQRPPAEVVESNLTKPARGVPTNPVGGLTDWTLRRVTLAFMAATAFVDDQVHVLDYSDLPNTAWTLLSTLMGFDPIASTARMREVMQVDSKTGKPFVPRSRQPLSDELQARIHRTLDPLYDALALRRAV